jgi:hypothetical protein
VQARRDLRKHAARIGDAQQNGPASIRDLLIGTEKNGGRPARNRIRNEKRSIGFRAGQSSEDDAGTGIDAGGGNAADLQLPRILGNGYSGRHGVLQAHEVSKPLSTNTRVIAWLLAAY